MSNEMSNEQRISIPPNRCLWHYGRLFFTVQWEYMIWKNPSSGELMNILLERHVFAGFAPKTHGWFGFLKDDFDGNTINSISVFGFVIGYGVTYNSRPLGV